MSEITNQVREVAELGLTYSEDGAFITALVKLEAAAKMMREHVVRLQKEGLLPMVTLGPVTYTAFCQESDGTGTIWIADVEGATVEEACAAAVDACRADWGKEEYDADDIHVLGLARGSADGGVNIVFWEDIDT